MDAVVKFLQPYQLHPVVDHFSVALLFVAVLIDLFAGANRIWMRYTALLLMILGALAAGAFVFHRRHGGRPNLERAGPAGRATC